MIEHKDILVVALKALIAGAETSALVKIPATFIAELASIITKSPEKFGSVSNEKFDELMSQLDLSTRNAAEAAVGAEQIKKLILNINQLSNEQLQALKELTQDKFNSILDRLFPEPPLKNLKPTTGIESSLLFTSDRIVYQTKSLEGQFDQMRQFMDCENRFQWHIVSGTAGAGKSRFALEQCSKYEKQGWRCGFLPQQEIYGNFNWNSWIPKYPTLLVIDYAVAYSKNILSLFSALNNQEKDTLKIRVLVLERSAFTGNGQPDMWLLDIIGAGTDKSQVKEQMFNKDKAIEIPAIYDEGLLAIVSTFYSKYREEDSKRHLENLLRIDPNKTPLMATLYGLKLEDETENNSRNWTKYDLIEYIIKREENNWQRIAGEDIRDKDKMLFAFATMIGGINLADKQPEGLPSRFMAKYEDFDEAPQKRKAFGCDKDSLFLPAFQPDLIGEYFVIKTLSKPKYRNVLNAILEAAYSLSPDELLAFFFRAFQNYEKDENLFKIFKELVGLITAEYSDSRQKSIPKGYEFAYICAGFGLYSLLEQFLRYDWVKEVLFSDFNLVSVTSEMGHIQCLNLLIRNGADINQKNEEDGIYPLLLASQNGNYKCVELLLKKGAITDRVDNIYNFFPLLLATKKNHIKCVELLLKYGADPNQTHINDGIFPLLIAAYEGYSECTELLLKYNATVNRFNKQNGAFPLGVAAKNGYKEIVELLIEHEADVNLVDKKTGHCALLMAAVIGNEDCLEILLKHKAKVNRKNEVNGAFPLAAASLNGYVNCAKLLIDYGADVNQIVEKTGHSSLLLASQNNHKECVEILLKHKAKVDEVNKFDGNFPLLIASQNNNKECVKLLLEYEAKVNKVSKIDGVFPLAIASQNGHKECVKLLLQYGAMVEQSDEKSGLFPLLVASQNGYAECVKLLINNGAEVDKVNKVSGYFPLLMASDRGHKECVNVLLQYAANVNQVCEKNGVFPLLQASQNGHLECIELLIENGADVNQINEINGDSPLLLTSQKGHLECVKLLLEKGAKKSKDKNL